MEALDDDVAVLKMVWHPAHFESDKLSGAAFERKDLIPEVDKESGLPRFVSVDEKSCVRLAAVDERIEKQGAKDPERRKEARFAEYVCGDIRRLVDELGDRPLDVRPERIIPENPAHCGIHNVSTRDRSTKQRRVYVDELRSLLVSSCSFVILTYHDVFPHAAPPETTAPDGPSAAAGAASAVPDLLRAPNAARFRTWALAALIAVVAMAGAAWLWL